jgi:hypothetical protein
VILCISLDETSCRPAYTFPYTNKDSELGKMLQAPLPTPQPLFRSSSDPPDPYLLSLKRPTPPPSSSSSSSPPSASSSSSPSTVQGSSTAKSQRVPPAAFGWLRALRGHGGAVNFLQGHPWRREVLLSAASDHSLRLWDVKGGGCLALLHGGGSPLSAFPLGPAASAPSPFSFGPSLESPLMEQKFLGHRESVLYGVSLDDPQVT